MTREEYEADICARLDPTAEPVPFRPVTLDGWKPDVACCHRNVNRWVAAYPGTAAVRGWILHQSFDELGHGLTAHSIVRDVDGTLYDITPVLEGAQRGGAFVEHQGDDTLFLAMAEPNEIKCLRCSKEEMEAAFWNMAPPTDDDGGWS
jgi:hypothetical protein